MHDIPSNKRQWTSECKFEILLLFFDVAGKLHMAFQCLKMQFSFWPPGSRQMPWKKDSSIRYENVKNLPQKKPMKPKK